jgi:hypothetical protein
VNGRRIALLSPSPSRLHHSALEESLTASKSIVLIVVVLVIGLWPLLAERGLRWRTKRDQWRLPRMRVRWQV